MVFFYEFNVVGVVSGLRPSSPPHTLLKLYVLCCIANSCDSLALLEKFEIRIHLQAEERG